MTKEIVNTGSEPTIKKSCQDCITCCGMAGLFGLLLATGVVYIVWVVYAIIGLTQVSDEIIRTEHCGSLLWRYVLTMIIVTLLQVVASKPREDAQEDRGILEQSCGLICGVFVGLAFSCWGAYEVWGRSCADTLTQYTLYKCALAIVVAQWVFLSVFFLVSLAGLILLGCSREEESPPARPTNHLTYDTRIV